LPIVETVPVVVVVASTVVPCWMFIVNWSPGNRLPPLPSVLLSRRCGWGMFVNAHWMLSPNCNEPKL
jgi:hypothetical protein